MEEVKTFVRLEKEGDKCYTKLNKEFLTHSDVCMGGGIDYIHTGIGWRLRLIRQGVGWTQCHRVIVQHDFGSTVRLIKGGLDLMSSGKWLAMRLG